MAIKTQGTQLFVKDPVDNSVFAVQCAISIDGVGGAREQIETTCLEDIARSYEAGLITPSTVNLTINADPSSESHIRLHELYVAGTKFDAAIGWGDGTAAPTVDSADDLDFPATRTYIAIYDTYVADFPFNFALNAVVSSALVLQLSGLPTLFAKA